MKAPRHLRSTPTEYGVQTSTFTLIYLLKAHRSANRSKFQQPVNEYKLELLCDDGEVEPLKAAISAAAHTGQAVAGWITVIDVVSATPIH